MAGKIALIIDDEPDITTYHGTLLSDNGWEVRTANSGNDGLALAKTETPDIVLLDVMMPERGGLSTLIGFRKDPTLKSVPVVLVTGIQEQPDLGFRAVPRPVQELQSRRLRRKADRSRQSSQAARRAHFRVIRHTS